MILYESTATAGGPRVCARALCSPRAAAIVFVVVVSSGACACVRLRVFMGLCMRIIICRHSSGQR